MVLGRKEESLLGEFDVTTWFFVFFSFIRVSVDYPFCYLSVFSFFVNVGETLCR